MIRGTAKWSKPDWVLLHFCVHARICASAIRLRHSLAFPCTGCRCRRCTVHVVLFGDGWSRQDAFPLVVTAALTRRFSCSRALRFAENVRKMSPMGQRRPKYFNDRDQRSVPRDDFRRQSSAPDISPMGFSSSALRPGCSERHSQPDPKVQRRGREDQADRLADVFRVAVRLTAAAPSLLAVWVSTVGSGMRSTGGCGPLITLSMTA